MSKIEKFWQDATADDVAEIMKTGKPIPARVRNEDGDSWRDDTVLWGWINGNWAARGAYWTFCQVYREPSYWTNKPDPGPEWRILHPDERVEKGDEYYSSANNMWLLSGGSDACDCKQANFPYRRRIEPVKPEPKHYVLRVGDSVETPSGHRVEVISRSETQRFYRLNAGDKLTLPNGQTITITAKGFEVTQ